MADSRASLRQVLWVYVLVSAVVFGVTRLEPIDVVGQYAHLVVAAVFLLTSIRLARANPSHFGIALGGLMEPATGDEPAGPLGLWDLGRAVRAALPSAVKETAVAVAIAAVVFPLYAIAFYWWNQPHAFSFSLPPNGASFALTQLVVVALPEEAFFRGYMQTALSDTEQRRLRLLGVELAPRAWVLQAVLFAAVHFLVEPHPARLAVFFPGLLFGWVRDWRGGIGAPLALHTMSNLYSEILARSWL